MDLSSQSSRIAQDVCTGILILLFTALRISILRSQLKEQDRPVYATELFSVGCIVLVAILVMVQIALASRDEYLGRNVAREDALKFQLQPRILVVGLQIIPRPSLIIDDLRIFFSSTSYRTIYIH